MEPIEFGKFDLIVSGGSINGGASALQWGPDGLLYVVGRNGFVYAIEVTKSTDPATGDTIGYAGQIKWTHDLSAPNFDDFGEEVSNNNRQALGIVVTEDEATGETIIYASHSDITIGAGGGGGKGDVDLDTNSGVVTRITLDTSNVNDIQEVEALDIIRGLPRSEENHATNGLALTTNDAGDPILLIAQGGHANAGAPSINFVGLPEYTYSAAVLSADLNQLAVIEAAKKSVDPNIDHVFDMPTLDDPTRTNFKNAEGEDVWIDANFDGVVDSVAEFVDQDGDGIPDWMVDQDGDGDVDVDDVADFVATKIVDADGDGVDDTILYQDGGSADDNVTGVRGGNDGLNQAKLLVGNPVQIYSSGYRNTYDVLVTEDGKKYTYDNGANGGWGGVAVTDNGTVTNEPNNVNETKNFDQLHEFDEGTHGGHPNPTVASGADAGLWSSPTANDSNVPLPISDWRQLSDTPLPSIGQEDDGLVLPADWDEVVDPELIDPNAGIYNEGGSVADGALDADKGSWNGLAEYTGTAFGGQLQGAILVTQTGGKVKWIKRDAFGNIEVVAQSGSLDNPDTTIEAANQGLVGNTGGGNTLGIDAVGDEGVDGLGLFNNTIWVGSLGGTNKIEIFEAGSPPAGADLDKDDDGIDHVADYYEYSAVQGVDHVLDPQGTTTTINAGETRVYTLSAESYEFSAPGGIGSLGYMVNGVDESAPGGLLSATENVIPGGAGSGLQIKDIRSGTAKGAANDQRDALTFAVTPGVDAGRIEISTRMLAILEGFYQDGSEAGLQIGTGDQFSFMSLVLAYSDDGTPSLSMDLHYEESDAEVTTQSVDVSNLLSDIGGVRRLPDTTVIEFLFEVDTVSGLVTPKFKIISDPQNPPADFTEMAPIQATGDVLDAMQGNFTANGLSHPLAFGNIGTSAIDPSAPADPISTQNVNVTYDEFKVVGFAPQVDAFLTITDASVNEATGVVELTVALEDEFGQSVTLGQDVTVGYTLGGDAETPADATVAPTAPLTIQSGQSTATVTITIADDAIVEGTETLEVALGTISANGLAVLAKAGDDVGTVTIADNDVPDPGSVIYRVNAGTATNITVSDGGPDWLGDVNLIDSNDTGIIVSGNTGDTFSNGLTNEESEMNLTNLVTPAPWQLFINERGDNSNDATTLDYAFEVTPGVAYTVTLFYVENWNNIFTNPNRIFDVELEGSVPPEFDDIHPLREATDAVDGPGAPLPSGSLTDAQKQPYLGTAFSRSVTYTATDDQLNLSFIHQSQNPKINAIEISVADPGTGGSVAVVSVADVTVNEGDGTATVTFNLSAPVTEGPVTVPFTVANGSADAGIDFTAPTTLEVVFDGTQTATATFDITDDSETEGPENFTVAIDAANIAAPAEATVTANAGASSATVTILDNDVTPPSDGEALYRVNVGGPKIVLGADDATNPGDGELDWGPDLGTFGDAANSPYLAASSSGNSLFNSSSGASYPGDPSTSDPSIPAGTPIEIFNTERYDATSAPEMLWQFNVAADHGLQPGDQVEVRLYFAELFAGIEDAGKDEGPAGPVGNRVFDVQVDGVTPASFDDIDPWAIAGANAGFMRSYVATVDAEGVLDLQFIHDVENPALKGIEIVAVEDTQTQDVTITAQDISADESTGEITITFSISETVTTGDITVPFTLVDGTATVGTDTTPNQDGSVTFDANDSSDQTVVITLTNDSEVEGDETFTVQLGAPTAAPAGVSVTTVDGTATIIDDDVAATVDSFNGAPAPGDDWSGTNTAPDDVTLNEGVNTLVSTGELGDADYITFEVAAGQQVTSIKLAGYVGDTNAAFLGIQVGDTMPTQAEIEDAIADAIPTTLLDGGTVFDSSQIDADLLPLLASNLVENSGLPTNGLATPLEAGTYTLWFNQNQSLSETTLEIVSEAVPGADPDDIDGDGIVNTDDPFAYDGTNGDAKVLVAGGEFTQDFDTDTTDPFSAEGGFSGILVNPAFDYPNASETDPYGDRTSGAPDVEISGGTLSILSKANDAFAVAGNTSDQNTLSDGYQSAVDVTGVNSFEVHARANSSDWLGKATSTGGFEQFGITLGAGGVDDFVKLVLSDNGGNPQRVQLAHNNSLVGGNDKNYPVGGNGTGEVAGPTVDLSLVGDIEFRLIVDRAAGANGQITGQVDFFAADDGALLESYTTPAADILANSSLLAAMNGANPLTGGDGGLAYGVFVTDYSGGEGNQITANYDFLTVRALDAAPDPAVVSIGAPDPAALQEAGDTGVTPLLFPVSFDQAPAGDVTVEYSVDINGVVTSGLTQVVTNTGGAITVDVPNDADDDGADSVTVTLTAVTAGDAALNADTAALSAQGTVTEDDVAPLATVSVADVIVDEDAAVATVTFTRTGASDEPVTITYSTADDSAIAGADYTAVTSAQIEIPAEGTGIVTVDIPLLGDEAEEGDEAFTIAIENATAPSNAVTVAQSTATVTLTDNDALDPDDIDGDGIVNTDDPFAYDGDNGLGRVLTAGGEFTQDFNTPTDDPFDANGGFSGILVNPAFDPQSASETDPYGDRTVEEKVAIANGSLTITSSLEDSFQGGTGIGNLIRDNYQSGVDVSGVQVFEVATQVTSADFATQIAANGGFEQFGVQVGAGGVDDFIKFVISDSNGAPRIQIGHNNSLLGGGDINVSTNVDLATVASYAISLTVDRSVTVIPDDGNAGNDGLVGAPGTATAGSVLGVIEYFDGDGLSLGTQSAGPRYISPTSNLAAAMTNANPLTGGTGGIAYGVSITDGTNVANEFTANFEFLTIRSLDDAPDPAVVSIGAPDPAAVQEAGDAGVTPLLFPVSFDKAPAGDVTVEYSVDINGVVTPGLTQIVANTGGDITVEVANDDADNGADSVIVTLTAVSAGDAALNADTAALSAQGTVTEDDVVVPAVSIGAPDPAAVQEAGDAGVTPLLFPVSFDKAPAGDVTVEYSVDINGVVTPGLTQIVANTGGDITVEVANDDADNGADSVTVTLTAVSAGDAALNADTAALSAQGTVTEDDTPPPTSIRFQAEDFDESVGYGVQTQTAAEENEVAFLPSGGATGSATYDLTAKGVAAGTYNVTLGYFDENDGVSNIVVSVDDVEIGAFALDDDTTSGNAAQASSFRTKTFANVVVGENAQMVISATTDAGEFARTDWFEFVLVDDDGGTPDNNAPELVFALPSPEVDENEPFALDLDNFFSDEDEDTLSYTARTTTGDGVEENDLPAGVTFDAATGIFGGAPTAAGTYEITVTADDGEVVSDPAVLTLTVAEANEAPTVDAEIPNQTVAQGEAVALDVTGNFDDPDGDVLTYEVAIVGPDGATDLPGLTFTDGVFGGAVADDAAPGSYQVTVTASDGDEDASDIFLINVTGDGGDSRDTVRIEAEDFELAAATPPDGFFIEAESRIRLQQNSEGEATYALNQIDGLSGDYDVSVTFFDESDGVSSGEISYAADGTNFDVLGSWDFDQDGGGNAAQAQNLRTLTFSGLTATPDGVLKFTGQSNAGEFLRTDFFELIPVAGSTTNFAPDEAGGGIDDKTVQVLGPISIDASSAFSDPEDDLLTYEMFAGPDWVIVDPVSGTITGEPPEAGIYEISVSATDVQNNPNLPATSTFKLTVEDAENQPPSAVTVTPAAGFETGVPEDTDTTDRVKVADIAVTDDGLGTNVLSLSDDTIFEIDGFELFLKAGVALDHETAPSLAVTVQVDDDAVGVSPDASEVFNLAVTDVLEPPASDETVVLRINAYGPQVQTIAGGPDWQADGDGTDTGTGISYLNTTDYRGDAFSGYTGDTGLIPDGVPEAVLDTARSSDAPFSYDIPVGDIGGPGTFRVNLYIAELFSGGQAGGFRVFDASLEGAVPVAFDNIDPGTDFGTGGNLGVLSAEVSVDADDGVLNIGFLQDSVQNPIVNAIEIVRIGDPAPDTEGPVARLALTNPQNADGPLLVDATLDDATGVDPATLGADDLLISGDAGTVTFVGFDAAVASYSVAAPSGGWQDGADIEVTLQADAISDTLANPNLEASESITLDIGGPVIPPSDPSDALQVLAELTDVTTDATYGADVVGSAELRVMEGNNGITASNFGSNSFEVVNTGGKSISAIVIEVSSALYPDIVFDPDGAGGDSTGKVLTVNTPGGTGAFTTGSGYVLPGPEPLPNDTGTGVASDGGFKGALLKFTDFGNAESVGFSGDMDPNSIAGLLKSGTSGVDTGAVLGWDVGGVSGLEMIGSTFAVLFDDGTTATGVLTSDGSVSGAQALADQGTGAPVTVGLTVNGTAEGAVGTYGGGVTPSVILSGNEGETVRITMTKGFNPVTNSSDGVAQLVAARLADNSFTANNAFDNQTVDVVIPGSGSIEIGALFDYDNAVASTFSGDDIADIAFVAAAIDPLTKFAKGPATVPIVLKNQGGPVDVGPVEPPVDPIDGYFEIVGTGAGAYFKMEIEDANISNGGQSPGGKWTFVSAADADNNQSGFTGDGYYLYGSDSSTALNNVIADEVLEYNILVPEGETGTFSFQFRVSRDGLAASDQQNDLWLNFKPAEVPGDGDIEAFLTNTTDEPEPVNNGYIKIFGGPNNGTWGTASNYDGLPSNPTTQINIAEAGLYTIQIAGRSQGFHVDSFWLAKTGGSTPGASSPNSAFVPTDPNAQFAPVISSDATTSVQEGNTVALDVDATDLNGDTLTYSISGGTDAGLFSINGATGVVTFNIAPDFENPSDAGTNNVYNVEVTVSDGALTDSQLYAITVTDNPFDNPGAGDLFRLEAESFTTASGYETSSLAIASGGAIVKTIAAGVNGGAGSLSYDLAGLAPGNYEVVLGIVDESDGTSNVEVSVGSLTNATVTFDQNGGGSGVQAENFRPVSLGTTTIGAGDSLTIEGDADAGEFARIDYIEFIASEDGGGSGGGGGGTGPSEQRIPIAAGSDDTDQNAGGGAVNVTKTDLELGDSGRDLGLRFTDLDLASLEGLSISDAFIEFTARSGSSGAVNATVSLEDSLSAATFSAANGPTDRTLSDDFSFVWTDNSVPVAGETFRTGNFAGELDAFLSANSGSLGAEDELAFVIEDVSGVRKALSFEGGSAPELVLVFQDDGGVNI